jgi:hypothetical protein
MRAERAAPASRDSINVMSARKSVNVRIATSHQIPAYGGTQHSDELLELLADGVRRGTMPMVVNHDNTQPLNGKCLAVEIVTLPDGFKAVDAQFEVDAEPWDAFQAANAALGVTGGMSFSYSEYFVEIRRKGSAGGGAEFKLSADASRFGDDAIQDAAESLAGAGKVTAGRLYQFSADHPCRIIIEYVQTSGGPGAALNSIGYSVAGTAICGAACKLLRVLARAKHQSPPQPQFEVHTTTELNGPTQQMLMLRTDDEDVLKHALDKFSQALAQPEDQLFWDESRSEWVPTVTRSTT